MNNNSKASEARPGERALGSAWSLWEKYQEAYAKSSATYDRNLQVIYDFSSLEQFALLWKHTTYGRASNLFYDASRDATKKFRLSEQDQEEKVIDAGHWCLYECPEKIADALAEWLVRKFPVKK